MVTLNTDSFKIKNYELTPEGYLKFWLVGGVPDQILDYGTHKESINEDTLFNPQSVNSAVGKPISFNHPPSAIDVSNIRDYSKGTILQEYSKEPDTKALVLAGIVHDSELINEILSQKISYISAGYTAKKELNNDGILEQKSRHYNHFALLSEDYQPRAGANSKIILINQEDSFKGKVIVEEVKPPNKGESKKPDLTESPAKLEKPKTPKELKEMQTQNSSEQPLNPVVDVPTTPSTEPLKTQNDAAIVAEKVELLTQYKATLESHGKAIDYNLDALQIKKQVLSCFYEPSIMGQINDSNIDGFWLGFQANKPQTLSSPTTQQSINQDSSNQQYNFDSEVEKYRREYIKKMEGAVA